MKHKRVFRVGLVIAALGLVLGGCSDDKTTPADSGTPDAGQVDSGTPDSGTPDSGTPDAGPTHYDVTILHTNDLHSYVNGQGPVLDFTPLTPNDDATVGGFSRLAARISAERTAAGTEPVLLFDSGDFTMGTPFEALPIAGQAPELVEMGKMGYDAVTFGNHEFDYTPEGLAMYLQAAVTAGYKGPIVASNLVFSDDPADTGDDDLKGFANGVIFPKVVKTLSNGLKVGIFGLLGKNAAAVSPLAAPLTFADQVTTATAMVNELRNTDKVDLVVLLSHSGSFPDGTGEDVDLAKAVSGIDVIISGHTHEVLPQPIKPAGTNTLIVQAGSKGGDLGELKLTYTKGGDTPGVALDSYKLIPIDDSVAGDEATQTRIDGYVDAFNGILDMFQAPFKYATPMAESTGEIEDLEFQESPLGDLVTDAYLNTVKGIENATGATPADLAIEVGGNIRTSLKGDATNGWITFADIFNVVPLGIGEDQVPGYPLVTFYLNGQDIKAGLEISALAKDLNNDDVFIQVSGLNYSFDPSAAGFGRVTSATIGGNAVDFLDTSTCYQVVATQYVASLLGLVNQLSNGLLTVVPKQSDCSTQITDFSPFLVDQDPGQAGVQPLHQWQAFLGYVTSFPDNDGDHAAEIPATYLNAAGRITIAAP